MAKSRRNPRPLAGSNVAAVAQGGTGVRASLPFAFGGGACTVLVALTCRSSISLQALIATAKSRDEIRGAFGFRTIEARDGQFYLNGEPLYLRGALDQDYYPDTICTLPSVEFLEDQLRKAKELGLNCLRCHIKAAGPAIL